MMMKKIIAGILGGIIIGGITQAEQIPLEIALKIWESAYKMGYEQGKKDAINEMIEIANYIEGAKIWNEMIKKGIIPPPEIKVSVQGITNALGYDKVLIVRFKPIEPKKLISYKEFVNFIRKQEFNGIKSGYYIAIDYTTPKPIKGLIAYWWKKTENPNLVMKEYKGFYLISRYDNYENAKWHLEDFKKNYKEELKQLGVNLSIIQY